jgi:peptidoglycan hydrolase CwlO-like protein
MKEDRSLFLAVIAVFLAVLFTYARFNSLQQQATRDRLNNIVFKLDNVLSALADSDQQLRIHAEKMQKFEERANSGDAEIKNILAQIDSLARDVRALQVSPPGAAKKAIELGTVPVKKKK